MRIENINTDFLNGVLVGDYDDVYYHFGTASNDPLLTGLRDLRAVILAGSGERIRDLAQRWSSINDNAPIINFPKDDRFLTRFTSGVLFASHGMGMPSASIALQEAMRMVYFLKGGDLDALDSVFWARVGTSGGVGVPGGTVVVTSEALMPDLKPYRLLNRDHGMYWFDGTFPTATRDAILNASTGQHISVISGRTIATHEFFLEQFRLDGAIVLETPASKDDFLTWLGDNGVVNIEMEGAMLAGYLNWWGFPSFAMICSVLLDRVQGDQVTSSPEQLRQFSDNASDVMLNYLTTLMH